MRSSRILLACLVALAFAAPALVLRVSAEVRPGSVGVAVAESVLNHWRDTGVPDAEVNDALESAGIRTVVLGMPSIRSYLVSGAAQILESGDPLLLRGSAEFVAAVRSRFGAAVTVKDEVVSVAGVAGALDKPLGYLPSRVAELREAGFDLVLALPSREPDLEWLQREITSTKAQSVLLAGSAPPAASLASYLSSRGVELVVSDFVAGDGLVSAYGQEFGGALVRAHLIELKRSDSLSTLTVRARRAEKERGVRLIVFQTPPDFPGAGPALDQTIALAHSIQRELPPGLSAGTPTPQPLVAPSLVVRLSTVLGAIALATLAMLALPRSRRLVLGLVGAFGLVGVAAAVANQLFVWQLFTFATAVGGAALAVLTRRYLLGCLVAVTTGLVVAALGAQSTFMNGTTSFLGVKALLLGPPMIVAVLAAIDVGPTKLRSLVWPLRPWHAIVGVVAVLGAAYYLLRSGNYGLVPDFELVLRDRLDELMYIRPRFKEALLGFPALFIAAQWNGDARWLWAIVATVGTASAVDSFAHFHTPVLAALLRTGYTIVIGLVLGFAISLVVKAIVKRVRA